MKNKKKAAKYLIIFALSIGSAGIISEIIFDFFPSGEVAIFLSYFGLVFSAAATWFAREAQKGSDNLIKDLTETQSIVRASSDDYNEVFDLHVSSQLKDKSINELNLLVSTPAYGFHVLGKKRSKEEFIEGILRKDWKKEIILFSPDAHFFHYANTLLWKWYYVDINEKKDLSPKSLRELIQRAMRRIEDSTDTYLWICNEVTIRIAAYKFTGEKTKIYLVLTDRVNLHSDLVDFKGRLLNIPSVLHPMVFGPKGSIFFDQFKTCPYSLKDGENAKIENNEYKALKYDYIFLRTQRELLDQTSFAEEVEKTIAIQQSLREQKKGERMEKRDILKNIFNELLNYYKELILNLRKVGKEYIDDTQIEIIANMLLRKNIITLDQIQEIGEQYISSEPGGIGTSVQGEGNDSNDEIMKKIVQLLSSGFKRSILAKKRVESRT